MMPAARPRPTAAPPELDAGPTAPARLAAELARHGMSSAARRAASLPPLSEAELFAGYAVEVRMTPHEARQLVERIDALARSGDADGRALLGILLELRDRLRLILETD